MNIMKIVITKRPFHLSNFIEKVTTQTRRAEAGDIKLTFIAKSTKLQNSFLPRATIKFNNLPPWLKQSNTLKGLSEKVRRYLRGVQFDRDNPNSN